MNDITYIEFKDIYGKIENRILFPDPNKSYYFNNLSIIDFPEIKGKEIILDYLSLSDNYIDIIPSKINNIKRLSLKNNQISFIPDNIELNNLEYLDLSNNIINEINYNILLNNKNLYFLDLSSNEISSIPENLDLKNLETLILRANQINTIPENLDLKHLKVLMLSRNNITYIPENIDLKNLKHLSLTWNKLQLLPTNPILKAQLFNLETLYLHCNPFLFLNPDEFDNEYPVDYLYERQDEYLTRNEILKAQYIF